MVAGLIKEDQDGFVCVDEMDDGEVRAQVHPSCTLFFKHGRVMRPFVKTNVRMIQKMCIWNLNSSAFRGHFQV